MFDRATMREASFRRRLVATSICRDLNITSLCRLRPSDQLTGEIYGPGRHESAPSADNFVPVIDIAPYSRPARRRASAGVADQLGRACRESRLLRHRRSRRRSRLDRPGRGRLARILRSAARRKDEAACRQRARRSRLRRRSATLRSPIPAARWRRRISTNCSRSRKSTSPTIRISRARPRAASFRTIAGRSARRRSRLSTLRYYLRMGALAKDLMRLSALALDLPETYFDDKIDRHISRLNVRLYPEQKTRRCPANCAPPRIRTTARSRSSNRATPSAGFRSPTRMATGTMFR